MRDAAIDAETFSSAVSRFRAIPNSLDGDEHRTYRDLIDTYFTDEEVAAQEAQCRAHASAIVAGLARGEMVRTVIDIGTTFAVRAQSTWLGWPEDVENDLVTWVNDKRDASREGNDAQLAEIADRFDAIITRVLDASKSGDPESVTARLTREQVDGRPLEHEEIVSILRNWTAGDLGSLAACVGVIVHHIATDVALQRYLRELLAAADPRQFEDALEEVLRIDNPFVSNRRVTTRDTQIAGVDVPAGTRVHLNWTSANRDSEVFESPDSFNPDANQAQNLVFGIGPHVCPGRALTLMELRVIVSELLNQTDTITMYAGEKPLRERPPASGWAQVPIVLA
ncbi:cytochrome P450 [Leucobacter denitrificans]|uniref:Cytochrome P450 n=1 Tax=Leucobacter denitrificans TaxID=683042 RepID=A0A7G9S435_9MICO|nr:cytochrome P450 [Leucobacter denitrificans]QNN62610.1 cytochrome P450 [Leucobacter denitrificans]